MTTTVVQTRQIRKETLKKVFMLFDNDEDDPIFLCFEQNRIRNILDIISYDPSMLTALTYTPKETKAKLKEDSATKRKTLKAIPLEHPYIVQIEILQGYVSHRLDINDPILDDYNSITQDDIDQYRVSNEYRVYIASDIPPQHKPNFPPSAEDPALVAFKRGIKRDPTHFTSLKRDQDWDEWEANMRITATSQGVEEVLNPSYTPKNKDDKAP